MNQQILQLGALGIIFVFAIKEFFGYLKARKNGNGSSVNYGKMIEQLKSMNDNHLSAISKDINAGNDRIVDAIKDMHTDLASRLGELKGKIDR